MIPTPVKYLIYSLIGTGPIGVVEADKGRFKNILEIGEVGAQVKHVAKTIMGSSYAIDRRKK